MMSRGSGRSAGSWPVLAARYRPAKNTVRLHFVAGSAATLVVAFIAIDQKASGRRSVARPAAQRAQTLIQFWMWTRVAKPRTRSPDWSKFRAQRRGAVWTEMGLSRVRLQASQRGWAPAAHRRRRSGLGGCSAPQASGPLGGGHPKDLGGILHAHPRHPKAFPTASPRGPDAPPMPPARMACAPGGTDTPGFATSGRYAAHSSRQRTTGHECATRKARKRPRQRSMPCRAPGRTG